MLEAPLKVFRLITYFKCQNGRAGSTCCGSFERIRNSIRNSRSLHFSWSLELNYSVGWADSLRTRGANEVSSGVFCLKGVLFRALCGVWKVGEPLGRFTGTGLFSPLVAGRT